MFSDENLTVEEQLAKVQQQLMALSMLPATIQQTLDLVTKKISKMVNKSTTEEFESFQSQEETQEVTQIEKKNENGYEVSAEGKSNNKCSIFYFIC